MTDNHHIHLRAMEPEDIDLLYRWENDKRIWPVSNTLAPFSRFALEQYVLNSDKDIFVSKEIRLMIVLVETGKAIGTIDLFDFNPMHRRVGVGILIRDDYRGKGYAGQALDAVIDYCFNTLMVHQVFCNIRSDNEVSLKLFTSRGFEITGNKKDWLLSDHQWKDEYLLQLINKRNGHGG